MENTMSRNDERRMVGAIEKAATLASADDTADRNELLAKCLVDADIDRRFAKTAANGFNRRLTVLKFQKTADEHKAEPFALADPDSVYGLMGGKELPKTASAALEHEFSINLEAAEEPLVKAASEEKPKSAYVPYEERVYLDTFKKHVESTLDKLASDHSRLIGTLNTFDTAIKKEQKNVAHALRKCSSFQIETYVNSYGERLEHALKEQLPDVSFEKTASVAVLPDNALAKRVERLVNAVEARDELNDGIVEFQKQAAVYAYAAKDLDDCLKKTGSVFGTVARMPASAGITALMAADTIRRATNEAAAQGFENAAALYRAGSGTSVKPSDILDAEFLVKDRFRDRLLAWSDMSADDAFTSYPSEQLFAATQHAMDIDPSLERPDKRELLRAMVGQLLATHGRMSTADAAAIAATLKAFATSQPNAQTQAFNSVDQLEAKKAPEFAGLPYNPLLMLQQNTSALADARKAIHEMEKETNKEEKEDEKEQAKELKEEEKAKRDALASGEKQKLDAINARRVALSDYTKARQLTPGVNASNQPVYVQRIGKNTTIEVPVADVLRDFNDYQDKLNQALAVS